MSLPTTEDAIGRYQTQVPGLRAEFAQRLFELSSSADLHDIYSDPIDRNAFVRLLRDEVRRRIRIASNSLVEAIDAGWSPDESELASALVACFNPNNYTLKSFDDVYVAAEQFAPQLDSDSRLEVRRDLGAAMVESMNEAQSRVKMWLRRHENIGSTGQRPIAEGKIQLEAGSRFAITSVTAANFKSIEFCAVTLNPLTILVGPNGAGKSNFLDALRFIGDALYGSLDSAVRDRGGIAQIIRQVPKAKSRQMGSAGNRGSDESFEIQLGFTFGAGVEGHYRVRIGRAGDDCRVVEEECYVQSLKNPRLSEHMLRTERDLPGSAPLEARDDQLHLGSVVRTPVFSGVFEALTSFMFYVPDLEQLRGSQPIDSGTLLAEDGWNIASVMTRIQNKHARDKQRIESYLRRIAPTRLSVRPRTIRPFIFLAFSQGGDDDTPPLELFASSMSDGTLRATMILTALLQPAGESVGGEPLAMVAFEEPETGLQPAAMRVLFDALQEASATRQVIVTSHSPDLLDNKELDVDDILAVEYKAGATQIGRVDTVSRELLREGLLTAGSFIRQTDRLSVD